MWRNWFHQHINHANANTGDYFLNVLVVVTLRKIWLSCNRKIFDNVTTNPNDIYFSSYGFSLDIVQSFLSTFSAIPRSVRMVSWIFPGVGNLKLNTDGSSKGNPGPAWYGGVSTEGSGHWVLGYLGRLEDCTSLESHLWEILRGLELVKNQDMALRQVNSASAIAVSIINEECPKPSPHKVLIQECRVLLATMGCTLRHAFREGNRVADKLADMGVDQGDRMVLLIVPSHDTIPLLEADMRGVAFERL